MSYLFSGRGRGGRLGAFGIREYAAKRFGEVLLCNAYLRCNRSLPAAIAPHGEVTRSAICQESNPSKIRTRGVGQGCILQEWPCLQFLKKMSGSLSPVPPKWHPRVAAVRRSCFGYGGTTSASRSNLHCFQITFNR